MSNDHKRIISYSVVATMETALSDEELDQIRQDSCQRPTCAYCPFEELDCSTIRKTFTLQENK